MKYCSVLHHGHQNVKFSLRNITSFGSDTSKCLVFHMKYRYVWITDIKMQSFPTEILQFLDHGYQNVKFSQEILLLLDHGHQHVKFSFRNITSFASWTSKCQVLLKTYCSFWIMEIKISSFP